MFKSLGAPELIIILLIIVMVFGVGKLPQVASSIGKSLKAFREGQSTTEEEEAAPVSKPRRKRTTATKAAVKASPATEVSTVPAKKVARKPAAEPPQE